jgi:hypothetical protein
MTGKKYEKPLYIDMDFDEALERFGTTDPKEVNESMERAKEKRPPRKKPSTAKPCQTATPSGRSRKREADGQTVSSSANARTRIPAGRTGYACKGRPNDSNGAALSVLLCRRT